MDEFYSVLSSEGRVTIPRAIRRLLNLQASDRVEFRVLEGRVTIAPARSLLTSHYQAIPPLSPPIESEEAVRLAVQDQVEEAAREGTG